MKSILNITNGSATIDLMHQAKIPGDFIAWEDVLHEGPVPGGLSLKELSTIRAWFIVKQGWASKKDVFNRFQQRDDAIFNFSNYDQVILWFENDLYDQLQLLQILDWLMKHEWGKTKITMIGEDGYLGLLSPSEITRLQQTAQPITSSQMILAEKAWAAFGSKTPEAILDLIDEKSDTLPFLSAAIVRLIAEYPSVKNGLPRTEQQILEIVNKGVSNPIEVFTQSQALEEHVFMGDMTFWHRLNHLTICQPNILNITGGALSYKTIQQQKLTITEIGQDILTGNKNFLETTNLNRWIGGVHISSKTPYCFDADNNRFIKT